MYLQTDPDLAAAVAFVNAHADGVFLAVETGMVTRSATHVAVLVDIGTIPQPDNAHNDDQRGNSNGKLHLFAQPFLNDSVYYEIYYHRKKWLSMEFIYAWHYCFPGSVP